MSEHHWANEHEWLIWKIEQGVIKMPEILVLLKEVDPERIIDVYQNEMERDGFFEDEERPRVTVPERLRQGSALWDMYFSVCKATGDYMEAVIYISESLTSDEHYELSDFALWINEDLSNRSIGHGNYWERYMQFKKEELHQESEDE